VAARPESSARGDVRDVRQFESERCFTLRQTRLLVAYLWSIVKDAPSAPELLAENTIWLPLRDALAILFLLATALRRFEFCRAVVGDVDFDEARLLVIGKSKIKDNVPLSADVLALIRRWLDLKRLRGESTAPDAPLFCATGESRGTFLSLSALRLRWKKVLADVGLSTEYGIHTTRHTAGLILLSETKSLEKVSRFLRHQKLSTTETFYRHVDADELRREISKIDLWRSP
jgi:integrase